MKKYLHDFSCLRRTIERRRRGGKGHRVLGDTAGSWFQNQRFRRRKVGGATVERRRASILGNFFLSLNIMQYCKSTARSLEHLPGICPDGRL